MKSCPTSGVSAAGLCLFFVLVGLFWASRDKKRSEVRGWESPSWEEGYWVDFLLKIKLKKSVLRLVGRDGRLLLSLREKSCLDPTFRHHITVSDDDSKPVL